MNTPPTRIEKTVSAEGIERVVIEGVGRVQVLPSFDRREISYEAELEIAAGDLSPDMLSQVVRHQTANGTVRISSRDTRPRPSLDSLPEWARNVIATHASAVRSTPMLGALQVGAALAGAPILGSAVGSLGLTRPRGRVILQRDEHVLRIEDGRVIFDGREISLAPGRPAPLPAVECAMVVRVPSEIAVEVEKSAGDVEIVAPLPRIRVRTDDGDVRIEGTGAEVSVVAFEHDVEIRGAATVDIEGARDVHVEDVSGLTTIRDAVGEVQLTRVNDVQMQAAQALYIRGARNVTGTRVHGPLTLTDAHDAHFTACDSDVELTRIDTFYIGRVDGDLDATEVRQLTGPRSAA